MDKTMALQKKLVKYSLLFPLILLLLGILIAIPVKNNRDEMKKELADVESYVVPFEKILKGKQPLEATLQSLKERSQQLASKFPHKEEEAIKMLSEYAQKTNIKVVSLKIQPKEPVLDTDGKEIKMDGKICLKMPVVIELVGSYKDLIEYIKTLHQSLSTLLIVEGITINRSSSEQKQLNITLSINLFLLG